MRQVQFSFSEMRWRWTSAQQTMDFRQEKIDSKSCALWQNITRRLLVKTRQHMERNSIINSIQQSWPLRAALKLDKKRRFSFALTHSDDIVTWLLDSLEFVHKYKYYATPVHDEADSRFSFDVWSASKKTRKNNRKTHWICYVYGRLW